MEDTKVQIGDDCLLDLGVNSEWYISTLCYDNESVNVELRRKADRYSEWWRAEHTEPQQVTSKLADVGSSMVSACEAVITDLKSKLDQTEPSAEEFVQGVKNLQMEVKQTEPKERFIVVKDGKPTVMHRKTEPQTERSDK